MAMIMLFKKGNQTQVKGIDVDFIRVPLRQLHDCVAKGWKLSPEETLEEPAEKDMNAVEAMLNAKPKRKRGRPRKVVA